MVGTPLIHSTPAGGAGTPFTCSDLNACSIAALGTRDHHLLTGLGDDDHPQYALVDKSSPSPWVAAADLAARSLADLGTRDHHLLTSLGPPADDHPQYALLAGRAGGQTVIGDTASGGHLTLQSTAHATRGYVRAQDDVQLLSNILRDAAGTNRIQLAAGSPHVTITGTLSVPTYGYFGSAPGIWGILRTGGDSTATYAVGLFANPVGTKTAGSQITSGVYGGAVGAGTPSNSLVYGLFFLATHGSASPCGRVAGIYVQALSNAAGTGALTESAGLYIAAATWAGSAPTTSRGGYVLDQGGAGVATAYGLQILDQTATTVRLLELGPVTPYLRLLGGAAPAANQSNLYLTLGSTLKQVTEYDADTAGAGYRALRVPN